MTVAHLGAHADADGTEFAVFSSVADGVDVCLFDDDGNETRRPLQSGQAAARSLRPRDCGQRPMAPDRVR